MTFVSGSTPMISRVASMPLLPGKRTSITTTSGLCTRAFGERLVGGAGLADDLETRMTAQQRLQAEPDDLVVVDQQDAEVAHGHSPVSALPTTA